MKLTICFDITHDRRRYRVVKILLGYGYRVQKSVFESILSKDEFERMKQRIRAEIDENEDSVRYYRICNACDKRIEIQGVGKLVEEVDYVII